MRTVLPLAAAPPTLAPGGRGAEQAHITSATVSTFPDHWREVDVLGHLRAHQGSICAYCGVALGPNDTGDVEHFRPKNTVKGEEHGYWWLAYAIENLFLACRVCNTHRKGSRFPLRGGSRASGPGEEGDEQALLYHPRDDDPDQHWVVLLDDLARVSGDARTVEVASFFDLNGPALLRERLATLELARAAHEADDMQALQRLAMSHRPHSLVAREVLKRIGVPEAPSVVVLRDRLDRAVAYLDLARAIEGRETDNALRERRRREVRTTLWEIAVLCELARGELDQRVADTGLGEFVTPLREQLRPRER